MGWLLVTTLCCLVNIARPDFGFVGPLPEAAQMKSNAELFSASLDELVAPLEKLNNKYQTASIRNAAESVSELAKAVAEVGKRLSINFIKASTERSAPVEDVFASLSSSAEDFREFLKNVSAKHVENVEIQLGKTSASKFRLALEAISSANIDHSNAVSNLQEVIKGALRTPSDTNIPSERPREVSASLLQMRDQVQLLAKAVDAAVQDIQTANSQVQSLGFITSRGTGFPVDFPAWFGLYDLETENVLNRYQTTVTGIHTDLRRAIQTLDIFSMNEKLLPLKDAHSEAYTRLYYDLLDRNHSDVETIRSGYTEIRTNLTNLVESVSQKYFSSVLAAEDTLARMYLSRSTNATPCSILHAPTITASIIPLQVELLNCLTRERIRMPRIREGVERVLQLLQANNADVMIDISSCIRFPLFDVSDLDLQQTKGCLETNIVELNEYRRVVGAELDYLKPTIQMEAEASLFRVEVCLKQSTNEASALIKGSQGALEKCAGSDS